MQWATDDLRTLGSAKRVAREPAKSEASLPSTFQVITPSADHPLPRPCHHLAVLAEAAGGLGTGEVRAIVAVRGDQLVLGVVGAQEVEGDAGALVVGRIRAGGVRGAVGEEGDAACRQLDID